MADALITRAEEHILESTTLTKALPEALAHELAGTASRLATRGRGILAADESNGTIGKRLISTGLVNDEGTRCAYREVLFSHPDLGKYLSGVITFSETLYQSSSTGETFVDVLRNKGVLVGIKVDLGLDPLTHSPRETSTKGLGDLLERCHAYHKQGARFAKWRAVIRIDEAQNLPTPEAIKINSAELARYAAISQAAGLVPIVEPEILIEGSHTAELFARTTEIVLNQVYYDLKRAGVYLEGTLLKPQMIMAGVDCPGIMFLSGGQTEEEATHNLNLINRMAQEQANKHPWTLSFSFGRSLQASVLKLWQGEEANKAAAIEVGGALAKANSEAQLGQFTGPHPTVLGTQSLHETHRGWSNAAP